MGLAPASENCLALFFWHSQLKVKPRTLLVAYTACFPHGIQNAEEVSRVLERKPSSLSALPLSWDSYDQGTSHRRPDSKEASWLGCHLCFTEKANGEGAAVLVLSAPPPPCGSQQVSRLPVDSTAFERFDRSLSGSWGSTGDRSKCGAMRVLSMPTGVSCRLHLRGVPQRRQLQISKPRGTTRTPITDKVTEAQQLLTQAAILRQQHCRPTAAARTQGSMIFSPPPQTIEEQ